VKRNDGGVVVHGLKRFRDLGSWSRVPDCVMGERRAKFPVQRRLERAAIPDRFTLYHGDPPNMCVRRTALFSSIVSLVMVMLVPGVGVPPGCPGRGRGCGRGEVASSR
jgi:hypothetical protein